MATAPSAETSSTLVPMLRPGADPAQVAQAITEIERDLESADQPLRVLEALLEVAGLASDATRDEAGKLGPEARRGEGLALLAWILADRRHDERVEALASRALALGNRRAAVDALLLVRARAGQSPEAEDLVRRFIQSPVPSVFDPLGTDRAQAADAWNNDDVVRSAALSRALWERSPSDVQALYRAGYGHYVAGEWVRAAELLSQHARLAGERSETLLPLGACLYHLGRYDDSNTVLGKVAQGQGEAVHVLLAWTQIAWNELGKGLFERADGAVARAREVLSKVDEDDPGIGAAVHDLDAVEGAVDACCGQLDLAHHALRRLRRAGSPAAPIVEEAITDVESGRVQFGTLELPRHRRTRPRGSLAAKLAAARPGDVVQLENGAYDAGKVDLPAGVKVRGAGPDTTLKGASPVLRSRSTGGSLENLTVLLDTDAEHPGEAILVEGGDLAIADCWIRAEHGVALAVAGDARPSVTRVELAGGLGLSVRDRAAPVMRAGRIRSLSEDFGAHFEHEATGELAEVDIANTFRAAVRVEGKAAPRITGCDLKGSRHGSGVWIGGEAAGIYEGNRVQGNQCPGFAVDTKARPTIRDNEIWDHDCAAIQLSGESQALVEGNHLHDVGGAFVEVTNHASGVVRNNRMARTRAVGLWIGNASTPTIEGNELSGSTGALLDAQDSSAPTVRGNRFIGVQAAALRISEQSTGSYEGDTVVGGITGIEVSGDARPVVRGLRIEGISGSGLVLLGASAGSFEGGAIHGARVGIEISGRAAPRVTGMELREIESRPVEASAASGAVLERCGIPGSKGASASVLVQGGAVLELKSCLVRGRSDAPAVHALGRARVRLVECQIDGAGHAPVLLVDDARGQVDGSLFSLTGGVAIEATGRSGIAVRGGAVDAGELVRCSEGAEREAWLEPTAAGAHAVAVVLLPDAAPRDVVAAALGDAGAVTWLQGSAPLPRASFADVIGPGGEGRDWVTGHAAWIELSLPRSSGGGAEGATKPSAVEMREFARKVAAVARATRALAVHCPGGARMIAASEWSDEAIDRRLGRLFCAVRRSPVGGSVVVDTVGLAAFGQDDLQCEVTPAQADLLTEILWGLVDAIVNDGKRYYYRSTTQPVPGHTATFMLQPCKHELAPARQVFLLHPIGDLSRGGGWAKSSEGKGFGKSTGSGSAGWSKS